ncbi:hypothetical protein OBRU01_26789, partial [Operophtera brumata]
MHICSGRVTRLSSITTCVNSQQRSAAIVPQQLLCEMAQQLTDTRVMESRVPVLKPFIVRVSAVCVSVL